MILNGYMGTVYVRTEEDKRICLWESGVWLTQEKVLDEMLEKRTDILEVLSRNTREYYYFLDHDDAIADYDPEKDPENEELFARFQQMIEAARRDMKDGVFDDSYGEIEITVTPMKIHIPQMTEYEWATICETQTV